ATFAYADPHEAFDRVRAQPGLYWQPSDYGTFNGGFWMATRFADIVDVEKRGADITVQHGFNFPVPGVSEPPEETAMWGALLMRMDAPVHSRVRRAVAASFGPRVVKQFDGWIRDVVDEVLDDALVEDEFDWVEKVAKYVPSRVVAKVLGVPFEKRENIVNWVDDIFHCAQHDDAGTRMLVIAQEMFAYIGELQQEKLKVPQDDVTTVMAQYAERGEITQEEFTFFIFLVMVAGYETTHTLIGQMMQMISHDEEIHRISREAVAAGNSGRLLDEFLRHITPAMNMARIATPDFEVAGTRVKKGDVIQMQFVAANRDPEVFSDPHRFDPSRSETKTLTFGSGPHRCVGNVLAKLEGTILLEQLYKRDVDLEAAGLARRGNSTWINQLFELPVRVKR
ncbi:MAG: cytochrome P450, partial [Solirubrobacteraceae bacterium]